MRGTKLEIILLEDGRLTVTGSVMANKLIALGMCEAAKNEILKFDPEAQPGILLAQGQLPSNGLER